MSQPFNMAAYCLSAAAQGTPAKPALIVVEDPAGPPAEIWSYAAIEDGVLRIAAALQDRGLAPGSRVLIRLDNTSTYALLFFGAIAGGFVPVPASAQLTGTEVELLVADSGATAVALADHLPMGHIPDRVCLLHADEVALMTRHHRRASYAPTRCNDPAFLIYTSGTTARPKGVLHAQRSAFGRRPMYQGWYGLSGADRMLHAGSFNWTFTLGTGLTDPWANGATSIVYTGPKEAGVWPRLIRETGATLFAAVPSLYRQILRHADVAPGALGALRHGLMAGETPPEGLFDDWAARTRTELYEALGMSEISTYVSSAPTVPRKPGAVGKPQAGRRVAILPVEEGEAPLAAGAEGLLAVHRSDPGLMLGYWNRPEEEAAVLRGDWFVGGDLAAIDTEGYLVHRGRANDLMNAFGYRVSPLEVEAALAAHPGVAEAACAERKVASGVSVITAFIVPRPGAFPTPDEIRAFAATRLAAYKCPREVVFRDALPRTANGKIQRAAL